MYTYIHMHIHIYIYTHVGRCARIHICTYKPRPICVHVCVCLYRSWYLSHVTKYVVRTHVYTFPRYTSMRTRIDTHWYSDTHITRVLAQSFMLYIHIHVVIHIHIFMYMCSDTYIAHVYPFVCYTEGLVHMYAHACVCVRVAGGMYIYIHISILIYI